MDEGEYAPLYPFITRSNLSDFQKILVSLMMNDIRMNGSITWKHETYANKMNASRMGICKQFKVLTKNGIIIPDSNNKAGSKNNKFTLSFTAITDYKPDNGEHKADNQENMLVDQNLITESNKPDNGEHKADNGEHKADNGEHKADTPGKHIKKLNKHKENNKERIKELDEETSIDFSSLNDIDVEYDLTPLNYKRPNNDIDLKDDPTPEELDAWLQTLDL
jgi:hypothetical protein